MGLIITGIGLVGVLFFLLGLRIKGTEYGDFTAEWKFGKRQIFSILGLLVILFGCYTIVPANSVGIKYNPFNGGTQETTLGEGFYGKNPLEKIYVLPTKINEFKFENISIQTKDSQYVNSILQVQARIDNTKANEYFRKYGNKDLVEIQSIIANTIQKEFEKVTTTYNIMEVLGEKRDEIVNKTLIGVKEELIKDGIVVERIVLVDTDAGNDVEQAIKNEAIAKKNAEAAIYKKQQAETEGEAQVIAAQKEKEANELLSKTLTKEILIQEYLNKWDGKLPAVTGDSNTLIDINEFLK